MQIDIFERLFSNKIRFNKTKRLLAIEEYFEQTRATTVNFEDEPERCISFIIQYIRENPDAGDDVLEDIALLLQDRYSNGAPNTISLIETDITSSEELGRRLTEMFDGLVTYDSIDFDFPEITVDPVSNTTTLTARYSEFFVDPATEQRGREIFTGKIALMFDLEKKLCIASQAGYNKVISKFIQFLKELLSPSLDIIPIYVQIRSKIMLNASTSNFDSLTMLVIRLVYQKFREMDYVINSVDSISFNNDNAPRVKNAKLGGNDLFADPDVVERIYNGDKITKITVHLTKFMDDLTTAMINSSLTIDFRGMLKFIFSEASSPQNQKEVCYDVFNAIMELLRAPDTIISAIDILERELVPNHSFNTRGTFNQFIHNLKRDLLVEAPECESIAEYFRREFRI